MTMSQIVVFLAVLTKLDSVSVFSLVMYGRRGDIHLGEIKKNADIALNREENN